MSTASPRAFGRLQALLLAAAISGCGGDRRLDGEYAAEGPARPGTISPERGRYLATAVSLCTFCHSEVDWKAEGFPPKAGTVGGGRAPFSDAVPWLTSPNLTPDRETGAGTWSDGQFDRALRQGIGHDDRTLFPLMPYPEYHLMSDDDAVSIVQFLRSIPPVVHRLPPTQVPENMKGTLSPLPPPGPVHSPPPSETAEYGGYLARIALCEHCHTPPDEHGKPLPGMGFAGGLRLKGPWGEVSALNITPDDTGIDDLNLRIFTAAVKTGHLPGGARLNAIMPWGYYRNMTDQDVRAIFTFLKSVKPVKHFIDNSSPPTPCRKCGGTHGLGNKNG